MIRASEEFKKFVFLEVCKIVERDSVGISYFSLKNSSILENNHDGSNYKSNSKKDYKFVFVWTRIYSR
jgi:hypothetical protein